MRFPASVLALLVLVATLPACEADDPGRHREPVPEQKSSRWSEAKPLLQLDPDSEAMTTPAPDVFRARFETTQGVFVVEARRAWSPRGVDRFFHLVRQGFFDDCRFFRVLPNWVAQFGLHGDPRVSKRWADATIEDEPVKHPNDRGTMAFATGGPNTRTTQLFINLVDNRAKLDDRDFSPIAKVVEGMAVVDRFYQGYGEGPPDGSGPNQDRIQKEGNLYLSREFPRLDYIVKATIVE